MIYFKRGLTLLAVIVGTLALAWTTGEAFGKGEVTDTGFGALVHGEYSTGASGSRVGCT